MDPVAVDRRRVGVVLLDDLGVLGDSVSGEEGVEGVVAAGLHFLELDLGPGVHGDGPDEADVDAEAAVLAGALEAHEDTVRDRGPLGVLLGAIDAGLVGGLGLELAEAPRRCRHCPTAGIDRPIGLWTIWIARFRSPAGNAGRCTNSFRFV